MYLLNDLNETFQRELGLGASEASGAVESILKQMHYITGTDIFLEPRYIWILKFVVEQIHPYVYGI